MGGLEREKVTLAIITIFSLKYEVGAPAEGSNGEEIKNFEEKAELKQLCMKQLLHENTNIMKKK